MPKLELPLPRVKLLFFLFFTPSNTSGNNSTLFLIHRSIKAILAIMQQDQSLSKLKELLESQYQWPSAYVFKFIVPQDKIQDVENLFPGHPVEKKASRKGNYTSVTVTIELQTADHVIAVYEQAAKIEGLIAL